MLGVSQLCEVQRMLFTAFIGTELDFLVIGNCILSKEEQNNLLVMDYKDKYEKD